MVKQRNPLFTGSARLLNYRPPTRWQLWRMRWRCRLEAWLSR